MNTIADARICLLEAAAGVIEACPGEACPFWEPGGALIPAGCAIERFDILEIPAAVETFRLVRRKFATGAGESSFRAELQRFLPVDVDD